MTTANATRTAALARTNGKAFTAEVRDGYKVERTCRGINHSDVLAVGFCDACSARVMRTHRGSIVNEGSMCIGAAHECDPALVEMVATETAAKVASGEMVKGCTVVVARGRKVAKGTTGVVRWLGEDNYGKARVGIAVEGTQGLVYTAASNCDVQVDVAVPMPATALAETSRVNERRTEEAQRVLALVKAHGDIIRTVGQALAEVEQTDAQRTIALDMLESAARDLRDLREQEVAALAFLATQG